MHHFNSIDDYDRQLDFEETMCKVSHNMYYEDQIKEAEKELSMCETEAERKSVLKEIEHLKSEMI